MNPLLRLRVVGEPAAFATAGERPWKETLAAAAAETAFHPEATVLSLDLVVSPRQGYPQGPDIDNLCDPVIATLVGRLGWFGGRRPAARSGSPSSARARPARPCPCSEMPS